MSSKPDPRIYRIACAELGVAPHEVVYLDAGNQIILHDFNNATRSVVLPGTTAKAVTAADLNASGVPEIAYINAAHPRPAIVQRGHQHADQLRVR